MLFEKCGVNCEMTTDSPILADLDPWERINHMPDERPLKSSEAAVLMTFSLSTLERMRVDGTGPDYFQGGIRKAGSTPSQAKGTNQHIRYFKPDIRSWFKAGKVSSSMQAAIRKGQAFRTIVDLAEERPFYLDTIGCVAGMVESTPINTFIERLGEWDIVWMPAVEAASRAWANLADHQSFAESVNNVLSHARSGIDTGLEATELNVETRIPPTGPKKHLDD
jgi:hypothetical protein